MAMKQDEFERRFDELWCEKYALYNPETDHWTLQRRDGNAKQRAREMLLEYARQVQAIGLSRRGKNKAQRLFDELGIDPIQVELEEPGSLPVPPGESTALASDRGAAPSVAKTRILYIERKAGNLTGEARIGRVTYSKSGRTLRYGGRSFRSLDGAGFKANYYCVETGEEYWISGCKRDGSDRLYGERVPIHIDEDVRDEYWTRIRRRPEWKERSVT